MPPSSTSSTMTATARANGTPSTLKAGGSAVKASTGKVQQSSNGSTGSSSRPASSTTKNSSYSTAKSANAMHDKKPIMSSSTSLSTLPSSSRLANGSIHPAPIASTSKAMPFPSASAHPIHPRADQAVRMSWVEVQIHNAICGAERRTMSAEKVLQLDLDLLDTAESPLTAINGLLRKHLLKAGKNAQNEQVFVAVPKEEARELGMMDPDDKMVLDHITQSGNQGMWTRTLKNRTGMHQAVVNRVIKNLEQRKLIKNVKSVKHPTRKIYMLDQLVPSIDLTGGPWYNGNELDSEFIEQLLGLAQKIVRAKSFPDNDPIKMWPHAYIPYLPTANDILEMLEKGNALHVNLSVEHVESILNVLVFDGIIERIWCRRYEEDGVSPAVTYEGTPSASDTTTIKSHLPNGSIDYDRNKVIQAKKRKTDSNGAPIRKKRRKRRQMSADSNDIDADSNEEDESAHESDISVDEDQRYNNDTYAPDPDDHALLLSLRTPSNTHSSHARSQLHKRPGPAGNDWYYVYRTCLTSLPSTNGQYQLDTGLLDEHKHRIIETKHKYPQMYELGFTQTPCGVCPVHEFCNNRGKPRVLPLPGERNLTDVDPNGGSTLTPAGKTSWRESDIVRDYLKSIGHNTKQPASEANMHRALLKMKCPTGSGEAENAGGVWSGGGKVGGRMSAPVNPSNCVYFARWFGEEVQW